eukprot:TRINITY_DN56172_c0_g1_i1.p1 TRINITY_DN56172_c0_g1~~TRINITY_DN56172_c0_g1_i1.p1  ORF type:complete len:493 (-),score=36.99 TRINITY_DN56172_c0_g1_i1:122-1600(-)
MCCEFFFRGHNLLKVFGFSLMSGLSPHSNCRIAWQASDGSPQLRKPLATPRGAGQLQPPSPEATRSRSSFAHAQLVAGRNASKCSSVGASPATIIGTCSVVALRAEQEMSDEDIARAMQAEEASESRRAQDVDSGLRSAAEARDADFALALELSENIPGQVGADEFPSASSASSASDCFSLHLTDAVWGELRYAVGTEPTLKESLLFSCCPCVFLSQWKCLGCCDLPANALVSARPHSGWNLLARSSAFHLAVLQSLALACVLVYGGGFAPLSLNPMVGPYHTVLDEAGAKNAARILYLGEWWRLLTPLLLHNGPLHLAMNLWVQLRTGVMLEVLWGRTIWVLIYIVSGGIGSLASCIFLPDVLSVGSSGSVCGLIGAWLVFTLLTWGQTLPRDVIERNVQLVALLLTSAMIGLLALVPMVDSAAHAGGLITGALLATVGFADRLQRRDHRRLVFAGGAVILGIMPVTCTSYFLFRVRPTRDLLNLCSPENC